MINEELKEQLADIGIEYVCQPRKITQTEPTFINFVYSVGEDLIEFKVHKDCLFHLIIVDEAISAIKRHYFERGRAAFKQEFKSFLGL
jgi:hypothetical protein